MSCLQSNILAYECLKEDELATEIARGHNNNMLAVFFRHNDPMAVIPLEEQGAGTIKWYCAICVPQILEKMQRKRQKSRLWGILFHHDKTSAHTATNNACSAFATLTKQSRFGIV